ncbi:hypothetical protein [Parasitella parasitica]|uniref:Uncharacterized protein n=1 Tax=Parasitella parasitica TaxID=35722 RepID=A0A0B7NXI6_9FUNG|nr:hypothetical protein [Parasitella parasitica]
MTSLELPRSREASEVTAEKYQDDEMYESDDEFMIVESPDLPAKDIRALVSVCSALCRSDAFSRAIAAEDLRRKLYHDRQESIPGYALDTAATLVNSLRTITPSNKRDLSLVNWLQLRHLRNVLVRFSGKNTKRKPIYLTVVKDRDAQDQDAVRVDHSDESRREHPPPKKLSFSRTGTPSTTKPGTLQATVAQLNKRNYRSQQESTREHPSAQSSTSTQRAPFTVKCSFNKDVNDLMAKSKSFNESFNYCRRFLRRKQLAIDKEYSTLVDIINGVIENHCFYLIHKAERSSQKDFDCSIARRLTIIVLCISFPRAIDLFWGFQMGIPTIFNITQH